MARSHALGASMGRHNFTGEESGYEAGGEGASLSNEPASAELQTNRNEHNCQDTGVGWSIPHRPSQPFRHRHLLCFPFDQAHAPSNMLQSCMEFMWLGVAAFRLSSIFQKGLPSPLLSVI